MTGAAAGTPVTPIEGVDAVGLWVGNARQAAHRCSTALPVRVTACSGPETGARHGLVRAGVRPLGDVELGQLAETSSSGPPVRAGLLVGTGQPGVTV